jgi:hypothetical protein
MEVSDEWEWRVTKAGGIEIRQRFRLVSGERSGASRLVVAIPAEAIRRAVANCEPGGGWQAREESGTFDPENMA